MRLLSFLQLGLNCPLHRGLENLTPKFLWLWARSTEKEHFLFLPVPVILKTEPQQYNQRETFLLMSLLQVLPYLNPFCRYQAESGNMFALQSICSRDLVLYGHVRLCRFKFKCVNLRINGAENCDGVGLTHSLCKGGSYDTTRLTGLDSMDHAWWRKAELLTYLKASAFITDFVESYQSASRNMLRPRNRLASVTALDSIYFPTST